ncbi:MAG TPA: hypothetical protein VFP80_19110 [Thermoanaerobaculia bacterium]|nr:hypothetical protein [Thermoanaerobaculia bacterium]
MSVDPPGSFEYDAFISYRRKDGSVYAERLRQRLVDYVMPKGFPRRRLNIFLDRIYEQANEDFFARTIEPALQSSKWLIVVQTPEAVRPNEAGEENWVAREVRRFRSLPQKNNVAVALAIGGLQDPLPAELARELPHIERVDISTLGGEKPMLSEQQLLTFIGPLHDVPGSKMPDLRRDAEGRARRRRVTLAATALTVIALLAALASIAFYQRHRAEKELMRQASLRLAGEASRIPAGELDLAYLLAVRALEIAPTNEAARALMDVGSREPRLVTYLHCPGSEMARAVRLLPSLRAVALTCDSVFLVSSLDDGRELHRETLLETARLLEVVRATGREQVVLGGSGTLRLWTPGQRIRAIPAGDRGITAMRASPDGTSLVTGDLGGNVRLWQVGEFWKSDVIGNIRSEVIALKNDADGIGAAGRDGSAWMRNAAGVLEPSAQFAITPMIAPVCDQRAVTRYVSPSVIEPAEELAAYANDSNDVVVARGAEECVFLRGNRHNLADLTAARIGERLLVASAGQIGRRRFGAIIWDLDQQHPFTRRLLPPPSSVFGSAAVAIAGGRAAIARSGEPLTVWRTDDWRKIDGPVVDATAIAVSHEGSEVAVVTDGSLRRFRIESNRLNEIDTKSPRVYSIAYDSLGTVVGVGDDALWRIGPSTAERVAVAALADKEMIVQCSRLTADGRHFLVVNETTLLVHDTATGKVTSEITLPQSKAGASCSGVDAIGKVAVRALNTYAPDPIEIFNLESKVLTRTLQSPFTARSGLTATLQDAMLSSDARLGLVSRGDEQSIIVWDTDSGSLIAALVFRDAINSWALSDSGAQVLAATERGAVLWPLAPERWIEQSRHVANRSLSLDEARTYGVAVQ